MENSFRQLGIKDELADGLKKNGIDNPTEIQAKVIPAAIEKKDIIGQSQTGTGKTLAYLLPILQMVDTDKKELQALILAPTHELVIQIFKEAEKLSSSSDINLRTEAVIGNVSIARQVEKLKNKPHLIVGTTTRVLELIKMRKIPAHTIKTIVIDEADRMLDMQNIDNVKAVIKTTLRERQLMMFSATLSDKAINAAGELMKEPEIIKIKEKDEISQDIEHICFLCEKRDKFEVLRKLVHALNPEKAIVFINKSDEIEITTAKLKYHKLKAEGIHGTDTKEVRKKSMEDFRSGKIQLLVASDIAARGLDIKGITHIFNLDIPEEPKNYLHRAGRTGRAGESGMAVSIITENEKSLIKKVESVYNININEKKVYKGKIINID